MSGARERLATAIKATPPPEWGYFDQRRAERLADALLPVVQALIAEDLEAAARGRADNAGCPRCNPNAAAS